MFDAASVTLGTVAVPRALAADLVLSTSGGRAENTGDIGGARSDYSARDSLVPAAGLYNAEVDRSGSMSGFHTSISISPESDARFNAQVISGQFQTVADGTSGEIESSLTATVGPVPGSELALPQQVEAALELVADKREVRADKVREQQLQENLDRIIAGNGVVEESEEELLVGSNKLDLPPAGTHPLVMAMLLGFDFSSQTNEALVSNVPLPTAPPVEGLYIGAGSAASISPDGLTLDFDADSKTFVLSGGSRTLSASLPENEGSQIGFSNGVVLEITGTFDPTTSLSNIRVSVGQGPGIASFGG